MKPVILEDLDRILLRKRALIETVHNPLKNISQLEHSRHRSVVGFMVNAICAWVAYSWLPKKPSLNLRKDNQTGLVVVGEEHQPGLASAISFYNNYLLLCLHRTQVILECFCYII